MNHLILKPKTNPFAEYGASQARRPIGLPLKFIKGEYLAGLKDAQHEVPIGTELVAIMPSLGCCWRKWTGSKPINGPGGLVVNGFRLPLRHTLGDLDETLWEIDPITGKPRDPWTEVHWLCFAAPEFKPLYTFESSSAGGIEALQDLAHEYDKRVKLGGDGYPMIAVSVDAYQHSNPRIGRVKKPRLLPVIEYVAASAFDSAFVAASGRSGDRNDSDQHLEASRTAALPPAMSRDQLPPIDSNDYGIPEIGDQIDDDIPF
jgi:hypothetical protein